MTRPLQDARRDAALDVGEELGIASQPAHHGAREEQLEQRAPAPGVPHVVVEALARLAVRPAGQQPRRRAPRMDQRQHALAERGEVAFELAGAADAGVDGVAVRVPERARVARQLRAAARVERAPIGGTAASRSAPAARDASSARYAATRSSRQASCAALRSTATTRAGRPVSSASVLSPAEQIDTQRVAGLRRQRLDQHVGVLPALRVADGGEVRARRHRRRRRRRGRQADGALRARQPAHDAGRAVDRDAVAGLQPGREPRQRHHGGSPSSRATIAECESRLPRSTTRRRRPETAGSSPGRCARPPGCRPARATRRADRGSTRARPSTTPGQQPMPRRSSSIQTGAGRRSRARRRRLEPVADPHGAARLEAIGRRLHLPIGVELASADVGERGEVGAASPCPRPAQHLVDLEVEDVVGARQQTLARQPLPPRRRCAARGRTRACARSAGSRGRGRAPGVAEHPVEEQPPQRTPGQRLVDPLRPPAGGSGNP